MTLTPGHAIEALAPPGQLVQMRWSHGELGRPGDNLYQVTLVEERAHKLLIEFNEQILAVLTEPELVRADEAQAVVGYRQMTLNWQEFGNMTPHSDAFGRGRLTIHRPGSRRH